MRIIRGTRDAKGNVITKQQEGGVGRLRCMKCQCLAVPTRLADGREVHKCQGCGAMFTRSPMDKTAPAQPPRVTRPRS
jgi:hypothetical protein